MKVISHDSIIKANFLPLTCYKWVEEVMSVKDDAELPPKISLKRAMVYFIILCQSFFLNFNGEV